MQKNKSKFSLKKAIHVFLALAMLSFYTVPSNAYAGDLPTGITDRIGSADISINNNEMNVTTNDSKWWGDANSFDVGVNNTLNSMGPNSSAVMLYNVTGPSGSDISGIWNSNCNQFLLNPNGVLFSSGAQVNVGGLVASTLTMSPNDFLNGNYVLSSNGQSLSSISNAGNIIASNGVVLAGGAISNLGAIRADLGTINLVAGSEVTLNIGGNGNIQAVVDEKILGNVYDQDNNKVNTGIENLGTLTADGGTVYMQVEAVQDVFDKLINQEGVVQAGSLIEREGKIILLSNSEGIVQNTGIFDVSAIEARAKGGEIKMHGENVRLFGDAALDASGDSGGGIIEIGGNYQGNGPDKNSLLTVVGQNVAINADAGTSGDGGEVILWSDGNTYFIGNISAKGGSISGDGGFVEVSGKQNLNFNGYVDTTAANGKTGMLLLDPDNIIIHDAADNAQDEDGELPTISGGSGTGFTWDIGEVAMENQATHITLEATNNITINNLVDNSLDVNNGGAFNLTITADSNSDNSGLFTMDASDTIDVTGNIIITAGSGIAVGGLNSTGSSISLDNSGAGTVDINGAIATAGGTFTSAGGAFDNTGGTITTVNGAVDIQNTGAITVGAAIDAGNDNITIDDSAGLIDINATIDTSAGDITIATSGGNIDLADVDDIINAGTGSVSLSASGDIVTVAGVNCEINSGATVTLTGDAIGATTTLDIDNALALIINDTGAGNIAIDEIDSSTIAATTITVADASSGNVDINYFGTNVVDINDGHVLNSVDLSSATTSSFTYTATVGNIDAVSVDTGTNNTTLIAAGNITTGSSGSITADTLTLTATGSESTIGTVTSTPLSNIPLLIDATTVSATTNLGHISIKDTLGGIEVDAITTGSTKLAADATRVILEAVGGAITAKTGTGTIDAWTANLITSVHGNETRGGAIGVTGTANSIETDVSVLNATADDGGIYIYQPDDGDDVDIILGDITARSEGRTPYKNDDGYVVIATTGTTTSAFDIEIDVDADIFVSGLITAPDTISIDAEDSLSDSHDGTDFIATTLSLVALSGGSIGIGQSANPFETSVETINATSSGYGVYITEDVGTAIGLITATGTDNDVTVTASTGNLVLGQIDADSTADAVVTIESTRGTITDNNGATVNILTSGAAGSAIITADDGIGTNTDDIETTVGILSTTTTTADAATYITNGTANLSSITVDTEDGIVDIHYDTGAGNETLNFANTNNLSLDDSDLTLLDFENTGGDINLAGVTIATTLNVTASTSIDQAAGDITVATANLTAGTNIGESGTPILTDVTTLTADASDGDIYITEANGITLTASAAGTTKDIVAIATLGDMTINAITSTRAVNLTANGSLLDGNAATNNISGTATTLVATTGAIGSSGDPIESTIAGTVDTTSTTGVFLTNIGALTQFDASATGAGDITFTNTGDVALAAVSAAGNTITLDISGDVTDQNAGTLNITASSLVADARSFGTSGNTIETDVTTFTRMDTTSGGVYITDTAGDIIITDVTALGSGADVSFASAGAMELWAIVAEGDTVTLNSGGAITDGNGATKNITAYTLNITAVGAVDALESSISEMTGGGTSAGLAIVNDRPLKVVAATLAGTNTNITADDITIFDNSGATTTTGGGALTLTANYGDIVFLNRLDTISTAGNITLTASYDGDVDSAPARIDNAMPARIVVGNLTSSGNGDITITSYSDITLSLLDAGSGTVDLRAANNGGADYGVILDGNGATNNIVASSVTLYAKMHSAAKAEIDRENAIARYEASVAEANSDESLKNSWESNYNDHVNLVASNLTTKNNAQTTYDSKLATHTSESSTMDTYNDWMTGLNSTMVAANVVVSTAAFITGAAQAVPFSGDAGADAVFAGIDLALTIADLAIFAYEASTVTPQEDVVANASSELDVATSNLESATNDYNNIVAQRNAANNSFDIAEADYDAAVIAREHAQVVRTQALASDSAIEAIGSDADTGATGQLEMNAGSVSITTAGSITTGPAASVLTNATTVTLSTVGDVNITNANSSGLATVDLQTDSDIDYTQTGTQDTLITNLITSGTGKTITVTNTAGDVYGSDDGSADIVGPNISITANTVGAGGELEINVTSSLDVTTSDGNITIQDTVGALPLGTIAAGTGNVVFTSAGEIYDSTSDTSTDITAGNLSLTAISGIGSTEALETAISGVYAATTATGDIIEYNTGALIVGTIGSVIGVTVTGGGANDDIFIHASSPLTVNSPVSQVGGGDITLVADGTTEADDLLINNTVTASGGNGNIYLYAGEDLTQNAFAVTAAGSGTINYYAGVDYNSGTPQAGLAAGTSDIVMNATATAVSTSGAITMTAPQDITLGFLSTSGNVSITADDSTYITANNVGSITEATAEGTANITAATATLRAATGIGVGDDIETNITTLDALNTTSGNIIVYELAAGTVLNINQVTQQTADSISVTTQNGTLTVAASQSGVTVAGAGTIALTAGDSDSNEAEDLVINDTVASDSGKITLTSSGDDVTFSADGDVTSTSGEIEVNAVNDDGNGIIDMADGAIMNAGSGTIDLNADANIDIASLVTTSASNTAVTIDSAEGALTDGGNTDVDIVANSGRVVINAITGVGSAGAIDTTIASIDIDNTTSGNIDINETDAITIIKAVQATNDDIQFVAGGTITADSSGAPANAISTLLAGTITLDANGTTSNIILNDGLSTATGITTITADNDVTFAAEGDITSTSGNVIVTADNDDGGTSSGALTMNDGTLINSGSGTITLNADEDITLGGLSTTNATGSAVALTTTEGGIVDGGVTFTDIIANAVGAIVTIDAITGVGSAGALETEVATIDIDNLPVTGANATGNIQIIELDTASGGLIIQKAVQGDVGVDAANSGNINISTVDGLINITGTILARDGGTITIDANDANTDETLTLTVGSTITSSVGLKDVGLGPVYAGNITLSADHDIDVNSKISTANANADYTANGDISLITDSGQLGDIRIGNEIEVVYEGSITVTADVDVDFDTVDGLLDTTETTTGANATITARTGNISETYDDSGAATVDIQANTVSLNAVSGTIGQVANGTTIEIDSILAVNADTSTGNGTITLSETTGNLYVDLITAGTGTVNLTAASAIEEEVTGDVAADIVGSTLNLIATSGGIGALAAIEINSTTSVNANSSLANGNINLSETVGNLLVGLITAGTGDVTLAAASAIEEDATADAGADIVGATIDLTATSGGIGATAILEVNATTLLSADSSAANGVINLLDTAGGMPIGLITAGTNNVTLTATSGSITDGSLDTAADVIGTAGTLTIGSATTIGSSVTNGQLDTTVAALDLGSGVVTSDVYILETDALSITQAIVGGILDVETTSGIMTIAGDLTVDGASTMRLDANSANLLVAQTTDDTITSATGDITLIGANILLGDALDANTALITSTSGDIKLTGSGLVTMNSDAATRIVTTNGTVTIDPTDVTIDGLGITAGGAISITGSGLVQILDTATVTSTGAGITITADDNDSGAGAFTMANGTTVIANTAGAKIDIEGASVVVDTITGTGASNEIELTAKTTTITSVDGEDSVADLTADIVDLDAATGIGTGSVSIDLASAVTITADTTTGVVNLDHASDAAVTISTMTTTNGDIDYDQTGAFGLALGTVSADTTDDTVTITAQGAITASAINAAAEVIAANIDLTTTVGGIGIGANGALDVNATVQLDADTTADDSAILIDDITGDLPIGIIDADSGAVTLTSVGGVTDVDAGSGLDIGGGTVTIDAVSGVGSANALDTEATIIDIDNTPASGSDATGNIQIIELATGGDLTLQKAVQGDVGIEATNTGNIDIRTASGTLTVSGVVTARDGATITLDAEDSTPGLEDVIIDAAITSTVGLKDTGVGVITAGAILITADHDIDVNAKISTANANASYTANGDITLTTDAGQSGDTKIGAEIETVGTGSIIVTAEVDVDFDAAGGLLDTTETSSTLSDATVTARTGNIVESFNDTAAVDLDIQARTITLSAENGAIGQGAGEDIDIDSIVSVSADTSTGGGNITLNETSGNLLVALIDAGTGNVTLTSASSITDADADTASDIIATALYLEAAGSVGDSGSSQELDTDVATIDDRSATENVNGSIYIIENDGVNLGSINGLTTDAGSITVVAAGLLTATDVNASGTGSDVTLTTTTGGMVLTLALADDDITATADTGNITIGQVGDAGTDDITITATAGSISESVVDAEVDITGDALTLTAYSEIGGSYTDENNWTSLDTDVTSLTATITNSGSVVIYEADDLTIYDTSTADGNIYVESLAGSISVDSTATVAATTEEVYLIADAGNVSNAGAITADTDITLYAVIGNVVNSGTSTAVDDAYLFSNIGNITNSGTVTSGDDVWLWTSDGNIIQNGDVTAVDVLVRTDDGNITDTTSNATDVSATTLTITATTGTVGASGTNNEFDTDVDSLTVTSQGAAYINENDAITLSSLVTTNGSIDLEAAGTITTTTVTAGGTGAVSLNATAGDIVDTAGGMITAGAESTLQASGIIGTALGSYNPVDVDINGDLWVWAGSRQDEVSVLTQGRIISTTLTERTEILLPSPPGLVLHDNHLIGGGTYGSSHSINSILSRGYGEIQLAGSNLFGNYYTKALQPWGYKVSSIGVISEANNLSDDFLDGPSVIIDSSAVGIDILPPELMVAPEKFKPQYYIIQKI